MNKPKPKFKRAQAIDQAEACKDALAWRKANGVNCSQMAKVSDYSYGMFYLLETGQREWSEENFAAYCDAVEAAADKLSKK